MTTINIELQEDLVASLRQFNQPVQRSARELIVLELYRRGIVSSGKAAELLDMDRWELIHYASRLGIPYFSLTEGEWAAEQTRSQAL